MKFIAGTDGLIGIIKSKFWPETSEYLHTANSLAVPLKFVEAVPAGSKLSGEVNVNVGGTVSGKLVVARLATLERGDHHPASS